MLNKIKHPQIAQSPVEAVIKSFLGIVMFIGGIPLVLMFLLVLAIQAVKLSWGLIAFDAAFLVNFCSDYFLPESYYEWLNRGYNRYIVCFFSGIIQFSIMLTLLIIHREELRVVLQKGWIL